MRHPYIIRRVDNILTDSSNNSSPNSAITQHLNYSNGVLYSLGITQPVFSKLDNIDQINYPPFRHNTLGTEMFGVIGHFT